MSITHSNKFVTLVAISNKDQSYLKYRINHSNLLKHTNVLQNM